MLLKMPYGFWNFCTYSHSKNYYIYSDMNWVIITSLWHYIICMIIIKMLMVASLYLSRQNRSQWHHHVNIVIITYYHACGCLYCGYEKHVLLMTTSIQWLLLSIGLLIIYSCTQTFSTDFNICSGIQASACVNHPLVFCKCPAAIFLSPLTLLSM